MEERLAEVGDVIANARIIQAQGCNFCREAVELFRDGRLPVERGKWKFGSSKRGEVDGGVSSALRCAFVACGGGDKKRRALPPRVR